jgi:hypothetical protein
MSNAIITSDVIIGQYTDYMDTGIWTLESISPLEGFIVAPDDLTISQLKDFLLTSGGAVYLREDGKIVWIHGSTLGEHNDNT